MSVYERLISDFHYYSSHFAAPESFIGESEESARETFMRVRLQLIAIYNRRINDIYVYLDGQKDLDLDQEIMDLSLTVYDIRQSIYKLEY